MGGGGGGGGGAWFRIQVLHSSTICEILLYNQQLVVITHELIYGGRTAYR